LKQTVFFLFLLFSIPFSWANNSESCEVEIAEKVYHFGDASSSGLKLWRDSNCSDHLNEKLRSFLLNASGPISSTQLERILSENGPKNFKVFPQRIRIYNLKEKMQQRFGLAHNQGLKNFRLIDKGELLLSLDQRLDFKCSDCRSTGEKNIEIIISNTSNAREKTRWLKADSIVKTKALAPKTALRVDQKGITPDSFHLIDIDTQAPEELFTNRAQLVFYRLNKSLERDQALTHKDLAPINLIKIGTPVKVILKNKNLSLSYRATALRAAKFGESIKLRAQDSNKVITGKVIDFNKVEIKL
jgi:flagella basal body P-ring formation protein FlgA